MKRVCASSMTNPITPSMEDSMSNTLKPLFRRGQWLANGKFAYKIVRCRSDGAVTLRDCFGAEFTTTPAHIEKSNYRVVKHKPRYANLVTRGLEGHEATRPRRTV